MLFLQSRFRRAGLLAVLVAAACDAHNPVATLVTLVPEPHDPAVRAEAVVLGSYVAPNSMPQPGDITSYVSHSNTGLALKPNTYTLIRISGTLQAERNPFLPGAVPGQIAASYTPVESSASTGGGSTNIWLRRGGDGLPPPTGGAQRISYYFRPDPAGRDEILLVRTGAEGFEVWSQRDRMPGASLLYGYCQPKHPYCTSEHIVQPDSAWLKERVWIEDFWVVQSHVVTATELREPLVLDGPSVVAPGATMNFAARPWGDLRFRDLNGQPSDVRWFWYPNDTTGTPPLPARSICSGRPTCEYSPKESGRLHAYALVEGALVEANKIVRVQQERIQLTCPDSVQRGSTMQCTVAAVPSGTLDSIRWTFVDIAGNSFRDSARLSWGGRMVVGGRMRVSAKLNGNMVSVDTVIAVVPRAWSSPVPTRRTGIQMCPTVTNTCPLRYPPQRLSHMGTTVKQPRSFNLLARAATIDTGPNAGWSYLSGSDSPIQFREQVTILNGVLDLASGDPVMTQFWAGQPQCVPSLVVKDVIDHEHHHADLYEHNRHVLDAELESTIAFVPVPQWRQMLSAGGVVATRAANRLSELSGGLHRTRDGFAAHSCVLNLLP